MDRAGVKAALVAKAGASAGAWAGGGGACVGVAVDRRGDRGGALFSGVDVGSAMVQWLRVLSLLGRCVRCGGSGCLLQGDTERGCLLLSARG
jgi:hypothetical protein